MTTAEWLRLAAKDTERRSSPELLMAARKAADELDALTADLKLSKAACGNYLAELEHRKGLVDALTLERDQLRKACQEVKSDFDRFSVCKSNTSDGEYTQDYTTRQERIEAALKGTE